MADVNHVVLIGRLTRDAELKYTNTGFAVSKLSIAVNRWKKSDAGGTEEVSYFDVVLWGKTAEALNQYLVKGKQIAVEGELRQNRWEQDGQNRSRVEISANNIQLLGGGGGGGGKGPSQADGGMPVGNREPSGTSEDNFEDDIPF